MKCVMPSELDWRRQLYCLTVPRMPKIADHLTKSATDGSEPSPTERQLVFGWRPCRPVALVVILLLISPPAAAQVCNLKVVTDASPDYTDMGSMIHSITSNWEKPEDKCWALWYWSHIARRQTAPMILHGRELTDPIRQFNDYGYAMCSTVSGINCATWGAMGLDVRFWDISLHTVPEVFYDGRWHMYDSSLSAIYTLCDGTTIAGVEDIGAEGACPASGGRREPGHIARYHCLTGTSPNGFLTGCDTIRSLADEYRCFNPRGLKYRYYFNNWDLGHRLDPQPASRTKSTRGTTIAWMPTARTRSRKATNAANSKPIQPITYPTRRRDWIRSRSILDIASAPTACETGRPCSPTEGLPQQAYTIVGMQAADSGIQPVRAGEPGEVVFKIEGANVITSLAIRGMARHADNRRSGLDRHQRHQRAAVARGLASGRNRPRTDRPAADRAGQRGLRGAGQSHLAGP